MNIRRKLIASTVGLMGLLATTAGTLIDSNPDDGHWPTKPPSSVVSQSDVVANTPDKIDGGHLYW